MLTHRKRQTRSGSVCQAFHPPVFGTVIGRCGDAIYFDTEAPAGAERRVVRVQRIGPSRATLTVFFATRPPWSSRRNTRRPWDRCSWPDRLRAAVVRSAAIAVRGVVIGRAGGAVIEVFRLYDAGNGRRLLFQGVVGWRVSSRTRSTNWNQLKPATAPPVPTASRTTRIVVTPAGTECRAW